MTKRVGCLIVNTFASSEVFNIMKTRLFITVSVVVLVALSGTIRAVQNTAVRNPAGSYAVPQSSVSSGLVRSPGVTTSNDLIMTGNVRRGKYFRGSVERQSRTNFQAPLGSTYLDSFLRNAATVDEPGDYPKQYQPQPFYSQTGTITTTAPGQPGVFNSATAKASSRAPGTGTPSLKTELQAPGTAAVVSPQRQQVTLSPQSVTPPDYDLRSMRISPSELERLVSDGVDVASRAKRLVDEDDLAQMERLQRDLKQLRNRASDLRQSLVVRDDFQRPFDKLKPGQDEKAPFQPQLTEKITDSDKPESTEELHKQLRQKLEELQKVLEQKSTIEEKAPKESYTEILNKTGLEKDYLEKSRELLREKFSTLDRTSQSAEEKRDARKEASESSPDLSATAKRVLSEYENFSSFLSDKSKHHIGTAEIYLKQGRFYQAIDSYTLASVYKPDNPIAYIGRSHALFAAGEYISSALFLSRALKISPEQAQTKVDFVTMLGSKEELERRIANAEECLKNSNAVELEFLLGYIYYQTGNLESAKTLIDSAYERGPESPAVGLVKKAIDDALGLKRK